MICNCLIAAVPMVAVGEFGLVVAAVTTVLCIILVCLYLKKMTHVKVLAGKSATLESEIEEKDNTITRLQMMANELKTPISLVSNPIKDVLGTPDLQDDVRKRLILARDQVDRLSLIVSMTLDGKDGNSDVSNLNPEMTHVNSWLEGIVDDFRFRCSNCGTAFSFRPDPSVIEASFDRSSMEKALGLLMDNILGRACGRNVSISTSDCNGYCRICLWDDGKPLEGSSDSSLAQARVLMEVSGTKVSSKASDEGNYIMLDIPGLVQTDLEIVNSALNRDNVGVSMSDVFDTRKSVLLIVDDQDDLLQYVQSEYATLFKKVLTARDGKQALKVAREEMPDIIVSDIFMPQMNGFMLCQCIKNDISLSHIPVILLTSRGNAQNQDLGYKLGADDFMPKPFDTKVMYKKITALLRSRYEIKRQYAGNCFSQLDKDQTFSLADESFIVKLNGFITDHIADKNLDMEQIEDYLHMSRTTIYSKINAMLGTTPSKYIRGVRIELSKKLLSDTELTIGKIAEATGFASIQYFSTAFKEETGMPPREYRNRITT